MKFFAYKYEVSGVDTLGLLPIDVNPYQVGFYNFVDDTLVLQSVNTVDKLQPFEQMDQFGNVATLGKTNKTLYERRLIKENLQFKLKDYKDFIEDYVDNADLAFEIINKAKEEVEKRKTKTN